MKLYAVQNREGKFFRSVGYGGSGGNWVELDKAKFYTKIGQARSRSTYYAGAYPEYGIPKVLEFDIDIANAKSIDNTEEAKSSIRKKKREIDAREAATSESGSFYRDYYRKESEKLEKTLFILENGNR